MHSCRQNDRTASLKNVALVRRMRYAHQRALVRALSKQIEAKTQSGMSAKQDGRALTVRTYQSVAQRPLIAHEAATWMLRDERQVVL